MIRKLLLPAVAAVLLGGCVTDGYQYRDGPGDYYYGTPSVDYRHYGSPYGYYGSPGYYYRRGYGLYGGFYDYPYYPYYPRYYYRPRPNPGDDGSGPAPDRSDNDRPAPWRDLDELRRREEQRFEPAPSVRRVVPRTNPAPRVTPRAGGGSRMDRIESVIDRARSRATEDQRRRLIEP